MRRTIRLLCTLVLAAACHPAGPVVVPAASGEPVEGARTAPALREADRIRLAEAYAIAAALGDSIWSGWSAVPFAVLLVTPEHEFLLRHPDPPEGFSRLGDDPLLRSEVLFRGRVFPPNLAASFPLTPGVPVVVIGQPEQTGHASTEWVATVLHEHFHQLQSSQPGYFSGVAALDLARGDETGMWMLNYPFPYDSARVRERFDAKSRRLAAALDAVGGQDFAERLKAFRLARDQLREELAEADYRYLAFQLWQEGVARYTELRIAELAARRHTPSPEFAALADYRPFSSVAQRLREAILEGTRTADLGARKRIAFYPVGAATALLLDVAAPGWHDRYLSEPFSLDAYLSPVR